MLTDVEIIDAIIYHHDGRCLRIVEAWERIKKRASEEQNNTAVALLKNVSFRIGTGEIKMGCLRGLEHDIAVWAQSLPQALTTGSTSTVRVCEHEFVNHIMPGRPQICKKCGLGMQS